MRIKEQAKKAEKDAKIAYERNHDMDLASYITQNPP
jgi:hypothetical protein